VTDSTQGSLNNNILGAVPHHPFYEYVTYHIWAYSLFYYPYPYVAVMYNSGQWFFTSMWEKYHDKVTPYSWNPLHLFKAHEEHSNNQLYRVIMDNRRGAEPWVFWNEGAGLTWQDWDFTKFNDIGEHAPRILRIAAAVEITFSLLSALVLWKCCFRRRKAVKNNAQASSGLKTVAALLSPSKGKSVDPFKKEDHELV
jgi:inositol phosphorylceramide mannosyltransferase catalytic subunit